MTPRAPDTFSFEDEARRLASNLSEAVRRPNFFRYKPHSKQLLFEQDQHKHRLYVGGNRGGKTVAGAIEAIRYATGQHPHRQVPAAPNYGRIVGTDFPSGIDKVIIPTMKQWIPKSYLKNGNWDDSYSKQDHVLTLANGSIIEFMSSDQDLQKFAGASRHWIWFDEEPPELIYDECRARLVDTNGVFWMTLTPVMGMEYIFDKIYMPAKQGHRLYGAIEVDMADNTHLDPQSVAEFLESLTPEQRRIREHGQFIQVSGTVFPTFKLDRHVVPNLENDPRPFQLKPSHRVYVSIDHGWRDPTAMYWHAVDRLGRIVTFAEYYEQHRTIAETAAAYKATNESIGRMLDMDGFEPYMVVGDPALKQTSGITGTSLIQEYNRAGIPVVVDMIPRDIQIGLDKWTSYLKDDPRTNKPFWRCTEDCPNLIQELPNLRWERRASRQQELDRNKLMRVQDKNNHAFDSVRYFMTLMDDLTPERMRKIADGLDGLDFADTLNAVQQDTRRDTRQEAGWDIERLGDLAGME